MRRWSRRLVEAELFGVEPQGCGPTAYSYDGENRPVAVDPPGTAYDTTIQYDGYGNRHFVGNGYVQRTFTFQANRLTRVQDQVRPAIGDGWRTFTTEYQYDGNDNVTEIHYPAPSGRRVQYSYDAANRVTRVFEGTRTYADTFSYHPSGAVASVRWGNGVAETTTYDQRARPSHVMTAGGALDLTYHYDGVGNVLGIDDPRSGLSQTYGYDALDRLTSATGVWGTEGFAYDAVGNRTTHTLGGTTSYQYNNNRLVQATGANPESFGYDNVGRLTGDGRGSYTYTPAGLLETASMGAGVTLTYRYDGDDLRTVSVVSGTNRYWLHGPGNQILTELTETGGVQQWVRDDISVGARLLACVRAAASQPAAQDYDGDGKTDVAEYLGSSGLWRWLLSSSGNTQTVSHEWSWGPGAVVVPGDYDGDGHGDLVVFRPTTGGWWGLLSSHNYDPQAGYLYAVWGMAGDVPVPGDYDGDGRSDLVVFRPTTGQWWGLLSSHDYDPQAGYLYAVWGMDGDVPVPGDYDGDGRGDLVVFRPTTGGWWGVLSSHNYAWQDGYLYAVWGMAGDVPAAGDYDGDGRSDLVVFRPTMGEWWGLLSSHNYAWQDGYLYAALGAAGDVPAPGDYDSDGKTDPAVYRASTLTWYVKPSGGGAVWTLPFGSVDQVVEYDAVDALGSVRAVTDEQGQVLRRHEFRPFGEEWQPIIPPPDARLFTGQERDVQTGFDYFGARYYRPDLGRFTTVDPGHVGGDPGDPHSWNGYVYVRNNPLRFIDPTGTDYFVITRGGAGFWFPGGWSEFQSFASGFTLEGGPFKGTIYNAAGQEVGTYQYFDPFEHMLIEAGQLAAPAVNLVVNALRVFGYLVVPEILTAADCAADWAACKKTGVMMAALSPKVLKLLGAIAPLAEHTVAQAIRVRGGGASQVNEVATYLQHLKLSEVAQRAADGDAEALKALKMVKQAAKKAQRY